MGKEPRVGIGVIVIRDGKLLMGKRKNTHGTGCWSLPGGHLEFGESFEECARRELLEETGLQVNKIEYKATTNDVFEEEQKHYVTIFMVASDCIGEVQLLEPEKCEGWDWFDINELPHPLFLPLENLYNKMGINIAN